MTTLDIVSTTEWHMPPIGEGHAVRELAEIIEVNVHHSDSTPPADHATCPSTVRGFDAYHRGKGWACIGYNRVVCSHGTVYLGRPLRVVPAAAESHNEHIDAICLIAKDGKATPAQWTALLAMADHDAKHVGRPLAWSTHREVEPPGYTECPGDAIEKQVADHRAKHGHAQPHDSAPDHPAAPGWYHRELAYNPKSKTLLHGDDVVHVQRRVGFTGDRLDGKYGPATKAAVESYQRKHGLKPDGVVGVHTARALA